MQTNLRRYGLSDDLSYFAHGFGALCSEEEQQPGGKEYEGFLVPGETAAEHLG